MKKQFFICGTDTNVGKTIVTACLCMVLNRKNIKTGAFKPAESGASSANRPDSQFLKKMANMKESLDVINPYYFKEPLAPAIAASRANKKISLVKIKRNFELLKKNYDILFVEGAGGLMVPFNGKKTNLDLIKFLKIPVIVVGRLGLGTINHTLLTLNEFKKNRIQVKGVILSQTDNNKSIADQTNPDVLKKMGVNVLGVLPFIKTKSKERMMRVVSKESIEKIIRD